MGLNTKTIEDLQRDRERILWMLMIYGSTVREIAKDLKLSTARIYQLLGEMGFRRGWILKK
jgi:DNA-binding transcriptional regulator LsrR (DeoR family)